MTPKQEDQLLVDYFKPDETIKVNCQWLQSKLRDSNNGSRNSQNQLDKALRHIERLNNRLANMEDEMPTYSLNTRV